MDINKVKDVLKRIQALANNPHWTTERRWKIEELAGEGLSAIAPSTPELSVPLPGTAFVNMWTRPAVGQAGARYHLSLPYATPEDAAAGKKVAPDAGWVWVATLPISLRSMAPSAKFETVTERRQRIEDTYGTKEDI